MAQEVQMPKLGQTMEEGTVERWLKKEGDAVAKGEPLFEVTTDKATLEVEAFASGTLLKVLVKEGETVPVNVVIGYIGKPGEAIPEGAPKAAAPVGAAVTEQEVREAPGRKIAAAVAREEARPRAAAATAAPPAAPPKPEEIKASPRARKLAEAERVPLAVLHGSGPEGRIIEEDVEKYVRALDSLKMAPVARELAFQKGIDLTRIQGSGPNGRIMKEDVERAAAAPPAPAVKPGRQPLTAMRRIVAQRMLESKTTVPHFYLTVEVDMAGAIALRKRINEENNAKVSYNDIIIKACAQAYKQVPRMNASWGGDHVVVYQQADIALAVAIDDGLMVPIVRNADAKDYLQISHDTQDLIARARGKKLGPDDYEGGSLTISNLGMYGIDSFIPIINPGQAGIFGIGRIQEKVVARNGGLYIRPTMTMTLACDHRVVNGAEGAEYLGAVKTLLESVA